MILSGLYSMTCTAKALEVSHIESPLRCHVDRFNRSTSCAAAAAATVSAWTSKPKHRDFSGMTAPFRLWL